MSSIPAPAAPVSPLQRFLNGVERAGNALPHPATLFALLAAAVVVASWICHTLGVTVTNPATGKIVVAANLLIGSVDVLLAGLTEAAAKIVDPNYKVAAYANYYFMAASTFVITAAGTWVTEKIAAPRLGSGTTRATLSARS